MELPEAFDTDLMEDILEAQVRIPCYRPGSTALGAESRSAEDNTLNSSRIYVGFVEQLMEEVHCMRASHKIEMGMNSIRMES